MAAHLRSNRLAFRRAAIASVGFHVALAVVIVFVLRSRPEPGSTVPGIDSRADDVALRFLDHEVVVAAPPTAVENPGPAAPDPPPRDPAAAAHAVTVPRALPPEMLAIIRRSASEASIRPAAAAAPASSSTPAIHGALQPGQTIVYILDCSGSMGEHGKLARARAALVATLRAQPEGVRFQVIAYNSSARAISGAGSVTATPSNIDAAETRLLAIEAKGRSNHVAAVRLATQCRPDVILLVTDAEELALAQLTPVLAGAGKPVALCVARATATGVEEPKELR